MVGVVFLHPDLGIGGAERAVIDAALALKSRGHNVQFITAHHDKSHCFEETTDGSLTVTSVGDWLPRSIFGKAYALCAYIRMLYAAIYLVIFSGLKYDVVFCDQISACIPVLRLSKASVVFYCHFPDMLLTQRTTWLKRLYRAPIDWCEEKTTGMADCVLVNSEFTAGIFRDTFKSLQDTTLHIVYPIPDFSALQKPVLPPSPDLIPEHAHIIFLSINRYERKKDLGLAIEALGELGKITALSGIHLIMAGGYDDRVSENKEYHQELQSLASKLNLNKNITFIRSFSDEDKRTLLSTATCLLYTPDKEHFGIVPIEAMYMKCPVIAVNSGGPLETVSDMVSGFLCEQTPRRFAEAMNMFVVDNGLRTRMGEAGHDRVIKHFSFETFTDQLDRVIRNVVST